MSFLEKIRGTIESIFQIGLGGPQLKNVGGVIEARNATDSALAVVRGGAAIGVNDLMPLGTLVAHYWYASPAAPVGGDGGIFSPFNTAQAALNAAATGDVVVLGSGTYVENLVWPATDNITVISYGAIIAPAGAGDTLSWVPTAGQVFDRMTILGVLILRNTTNGGRCLVLDGDLTAVATITKFLRVAGIFDRVLLDKSGTGDAAFIRSTGVLEVVNAVGLQGTGTVVAGWTGKTTLRNVGYVAFSGSVLGLLGGSSLDYEYDDNVAKPTPTGGRQGVYLFSGTACNGSVVVGKTPLFVVDSTSVIYGNVSDSGLTTFIAPNHAPIIVFLGTLGTAGTTPSLTLSLPALVATGIPFIDLGRGTFYGVVSVSSFALGIARNGVRAQQARLFKTTAGGVLCGADTDLDIRGAYFVQAALSVAGNGAIDRDRHRIAAQPIALLGTAIVITPQFPTGVVYDVMLEAAAPLSAGITVKTPTGFTVTPSVAGTVNLDLLRAP